MTYTYKNGGLNVVQAAVEYFQMTGIPVKISLCQFKGSRRFFAITTSFELVSYFLIVVQAGKTSLLDSGNVYKHVIAAIVWLNKAEAFS
jgi:hypothetical protein